MSAEVCDPESKAGVLRSRVNNDQRLAFSAPEDARVVESRNIGKGRPWSIALFRRCGRDVDHDRWSSGTVQTTCVPSRPEPVVQSFSPSRPVCTTA